VVKYYRNGVLGYTSGVAPVHPLLVDTALNNTSATITNAMIMGASAGPPPLPELSISDASVSEGIAGRRR